MTGPSLWLPGPSLCFSKGGLLPPLAVGSPRRQGKADGRALLASQPQTLWKWEVTLKPAALVVVPDLANFSGAVWDTGGH